MDAEIREYEEADYEACRALWVQLTERHRVIYGDPAIGGDDPGGGFDAYLANPNRRVTWVADHGGEAIGMAGLIVHGDEAAVEPAVVARAFRSRGVGRALVARAVEEAQRMGVRFLSAQPVARNLEAISFFLNCGFDILGHVDLFQDLAPGQGREWKSGITLHGRRLRY